MIGSIGAIGRSTCMTTKSIIPFKHGVVVLGSVVVSLLYVWVCCVVLCCIVLVVCALCASTHNKGNLDPRAIIQSIPP